MPETDTRREEVEELTSKIESHPYLGDSMKSAKREIKSLGFDVFLMWDGYKVSMNPDLEELCTAFNTPSVNSGQRVIAVANYPSHLAENLNQFSHPISRVIDLIPEKNDNRKITSVYVFDYHGKPIYSKTRKINF